MRRELFLILAATIVSGVVGWLVGVAFREPAPTRTPPSSLLSAWTLAMFALPAIAVAAYLLAPRDPARAFFAAFFANLGAGLAMGVTVPLAAFAPADFAPLLPIDRLATIGRGVAGSAAFGMLAGACAYAAAHWRRTEPDPKPRPESEPRAAPLPEPAPTRRPREPDAEALAVAQRRLAMGEITRQDYDELVRRLRD